MTAYHRLKAQLANRYQTAESWRIWARDLEIDSTMINLDGLTSSEAWSNILDASRTDEQIDILRDLLKEPYPELADLVEEYREELRNTRKRGPTIPLTVRLVWGILSLIVIAPFAAARWYQTELPYWFLALVILGFVFFVFALSAFIPPLHRLLLGFYSKDQKLIPGLGLTGLVLAVAVIASAYFAWPRIAAVALETISPPDGNAFFSVLVSRLHDDDPEDRQTHIVSRALEHSLGDHVSTAETQRVLRRGWNGKSLDSAQATGKQWLDDSCRNLLIWGEVLAADRSLNLNFLNRETSSPAPGAQYGVSNNLQISQDFNQKVGAIAAQTAAVYAQQNQLSDKKWALALLTKLESDRADSEESCQYDLAVAKLALAIGQQLPSNAVGQKMSPHKRMLFRALKIYDGIQGSCLDDSVYASKENGRGTTLARLGEQPGEETAKRREYFEAAVVAFKNSLDNLPEEKVSEKATTLTNRGIALARLADIENNTELFKQAQSDFEEALELSKQSQGAFDPASAKNNLANVLVALGRRERNPALLKQAVGAYCDVAQIWQKNSEAATVARARKEPSHCPKTRKDDHKMTLGNAAAAQNNLCWTLLNLADLESGQNSIERLDLAICACRKALQTWRSDDLNWPHAQDNLGVALTKKGQLNNDTTSLKQAVNAHRCALTKWTDRSLEWAGAKYNLGKALDALGERTQDTKTLEQALAAFADASSVPDQTDENYAENQVGLGDTAAALGKRKGNIAYLQKAAAAYTAALNYYQKQTGPENAAQAESLQKKLADLDSQQQQDTDSQTQTGAGDSELQTDTSDCTPLPPQCGDACVALGNDTN
jgi:tetratricopeptide (TPR) repeat protein